MSIWCAVRDSNPRLPACKTKNELIYCRLLMSISVTESWGSGNKNGPCDFYQYLPFCGQGTRDFPRGLSPLCATLLQISFPVCVTGVSTNQFRHDDSVG
jgi:hypothetical protein